jgi:hypothetical protein
VSRHLQIQSTDSGATTTARNPLSGVLRVFSGPLRPQALANPRLAPMPFNLICPTGATGKQPKKALESPVNRPHARVRFGPAGEVIERRS